MSFKCPDCGASLTDDSRFCKYCGAKIDDGVKRMEIRIDKRIEDVAEVKRATYEEQESLLRQKKTARELQSVKTKRICLIGLAAIFLVMILVGLLLGPTKSGGMNGVEIVGIFGSVWAVWTIISIIIKGKW